MTKTWTEILWSCVASPCTDDREAGSAFCTVHKKAHEDSDYPAQLQAAMDRYEAEKKAKGK